MGRKFEIKTDHKPLIPIMEKKDLCGLAIRLRLMGYNFEIFHTPGKNMLLAVVLVLVLLTPLIKKKR